LCAVNYCIFQVTRFGKFVFIW